MVALFVFTVFMVDGNSILQILIISLSWRFLFDQSKIFPITFIPGVLNLQGFHLSKSRSERKPTLCERRERKVDGLPLFRISAEGAWFIWVLQGMKIQTNYCKSILVNQPVSWELMLL